MVKPFALCGWVGAPAHTAKNTEGSPHYASLADHPINHQVTTSSGCEPRISLRTSKSFVFSGAPGRARNGLDEGPQKPISASILSKTLPILSSWQVLSASPKLSSSPIHQTRNKLKGETWNRLWGGSMTQAAPYLALTNRSKPLKPEPAPLRFPHRFASRRLCCAWGLGWPSRRASRGAVRSSRSSRAGCLRRCKSSARRTWLSCAQILGSNPCACRHGAGGIRRWHRVAPKDDVDGTVRRWWSGLWSVSRWQQLQRVEENEGTSVAEAQRR